jgi:hypothetical protein
MFTFSKVFKLKNVQDKNCSNFKTFELKCSDFKEKKTKNREKERKKPNFLKNKTRKNLKQ